MSTHASANSNWNTEVYAWSFSKFSSVWNKGRPIKTCKTISQARSELVLVKPDCFDVSFDCPFPEKREADKKAYMKRLSRILEGTGYLAGDPVTKVVKGYVHDGYFVVKVVRGTV